MKKRVFFLIILFFHVVCGVGQISHNYTAKVVDSQKKPLNNVAVFLKDKKVTTADSKGVFSLTYKQIKSISRIQLYKEKYRVKTIKFPVSNLQKKHLIVLEKLEYQLSEVVIRKENTQLRNFRTLRDVEGMTINAGRKSEVVLLNDMTINKVTNNARQIFSKVVGVTINESSEGGLQLNIGGRGLNPNRTANFNTRQNGYDISADVLGYPESYYTPPTEALEEIQVIRGAASLQYGTQFGGMVNFKMERPYKKPFHISQRTSYGSYNLFSSFSKISGTLGNFSYYTYYNYKQGDGFRSNSRYRSQNAFINLNYHWGGKNSIHFDWVKYHYLAKQPGGLTNYMFYDNPLQSNRKRNWFRVDWNVLNLKYMHDFSHTMRFSIQGFGLMAERTALGYRSYRVSQPDDENLPRDLLVGKFRNWGIESRLIKHYSIYNQNNTLLAGIKYYQSENSSQQGVGSAKSDADFDFATKEFPYYEQQSRFTYPNLNLAFFAENIFKLNKKTTLTPGIRFEKIKTESKGNYRMIAKVPYTDIIVSDTTINDNVTKDRYVFLAGLALSHKFNQMELYGNFSRNYRSVTFNDIHSNMPGFAIAPNISDEKGFSSDIGLKGKWKDILYFDCSIYGLYYGDKIGEYYHVNSNSGAVERYRDNVGTALTYGFESLLNWDMNETWWKKENLKLNFFINTSFTGSSYLSSDIPNIKGNQVEFVPLVNLKSGLEFGYKNFLLTAQLSYVSSQFADATNQDTPKKENLYGVFGKIPAYYVIDISTSYKINQHIKLESTIQNLTDNYYFTQRATGYPGPGIIPSMPFNYVVTLSLEM